MQSKIYFTYIISIFYSLKLTFLTKISKFLLRKTFASIKIYKQGNKKETLELNEDTVLFVSKKSNLDILCIYFLYFLSKIISYLNEITCTKIYI